MSSQESKQEIVLKYQQMKQELQALQSKVMELEGEKEEHQLVISTLTPLDKDRKCFRLINGVLVERTVKDVLPAVQTNMDGLKDIITKMASTTQSKLEALKKYEKEKGIEIKSTA